MARKRLNVKFIILGVAAFVVLGAAATTYKFRKRLFYNPDKLMVEGKKFLAEGNADEAGKRFYEVGGIRGGGDPELYVLLGDVHDLKAGEDPDNHLRKAYGFWQNALSVDPRYLPALHRLLDRSLEVVAIEPRNSAYQGLRDAAQRLLVVDPEDKKAQYALHMATVQLKLTGGQVDQSAVDESIKALEKRFAEDPDDADAMYHVAVAKLHRAQDAYGSNDDTTMRNLMNEVVAMQDTAVQARPGNAALHLRSAQTSLHLASLELVTRNDPKKWIERAMQFATKARELAKPGEKYFRDIHHLYAKMLRDDRKIDEAEQVLREVLKLDPNDQMTKIALAETIGANPKRREEAVKLLTEPPPAPKTLKGIAAATAKHMEAAALMTLLDIKLDELELAKTPEERQQGLAYVEEKFNRLKSMIGDRPDVMSVWGRIQMSKGDVAGAVQTFSTALRSAEQMSSHNRLRTKAMLAHGYTMTGQSGQAKREYAELLRMTDTPGGNEGTIPQRIRLVELLLAENNVEEARPHVELIEKIRPPGDVAAAALRIGVLTKPEEQAERKKLFDKLPEENRNQVLAKARIAARYLKDDETFVKMLEKLRATDPTDIEVLGALTDHYLAKNKKDKAEQIIDEALAKQPDNLQLQMAKKRMAVTTPEEAAKLRHEAVDQITDPVRKALRQSELAFNENKLDEARAHLASAEKLKPDDLAVIDFAYRFHTSQKEFDKAQQYLDRLAQKDPGRGEIERINFAMIRGELKQALELAQKMTRDRSEFALSYLMLAQVHGAMNNLPEAIAAYKSALERDSRNLEALRGIVTSYYYAGQPNEAKRYLDTARRIYPNHAQFREMALSHETQYGDPEQAIAPRQQQLNEDKENPNNWLALGGAYVSAYRHKSNAGKEADAKAHLAKAEQTLKEGHAKWPDDERFATGLAQVSLRIPKYEQGEKVLRDFAARPMWKDRHEPALFIADYLIAAGKHAEAEKEYRALIEKTKDAGLQLRLADIIFKQQPERLDDALAVLAQHNADHPGLRRQKIDLLVRGGRVADAQKELDAILAQQPKPDSGLFDLQAYIHLASGKSAEAMTAVNKALELDPQNPMALFRRGLLRLNSRGDVEGAIADLNAVRNLAPGLAEPRVLLARAHRARNDQDAAIRELENAVRDIPTDRSLRLELVKGYSEAVPQRWNEAERVLREAREVPTLAKDPAILQAEAKMWAARNEMQKAVRTIQEAATAAPQDVTIVQTLLEILNKGKQYKEVLAITDRFLKARPNTWWALEARGIARARSDDKDAALVEFEQALKVAGDAKDESATQSIVTHIANEVGIAAAMRRVEPKAANDARWKMVAAQLCRSQGDYAAALRWVQQVLADPKVTGRERDNVMHLAGELYCHTTPPDFAKATEVFKKLVETNPEDVSALNNLAAVMTMPGAPSRPEDALQYSQKAYDLMTRSGGAEAAILDTHGSILVQVGRVEEGIGILQTAIDRKPLPDAYFHLGDAFLKQSKPDQAENALRQALDLIARAERDKQAVDPTLRNRVDEALLRASAMKQQKTSGAQ